MDIDRTFGYAALVGLAVLVGACAKGSDLDESDFKSAGRGGSGGKAIVGAGGAASGDAGGGAIENALGGGTTKAGAGGVVGAGGLNAAAGLGQAGAIVLSRGGGAQGLGGVQGSGGDTADGTAGASDVKAPVSGVGVHQTVAAIGEKASAIPFNLKLENNSGGSIDITKVTIHYYFTCDGWLNPTGKVYYAGANAGANAVTATIELKPMAEEEGADYFAEIGFSKATLANNGVLEFNGELFDAKYEGSFDVANDYSYTGLQGYNDHITVYVDGVLSWGIEPGTDGGVDGAGGANGEGGAESAGAAGSADNGEGGAVSATGGDSGEAGAAMADGGTSASGGTKEAASGGSSPGGASATNVAGGAKSGQGGVGATAGSAGLGATATTNGGSTSVDAGASVGGNSVDVSAVGGVSLSG
jgi:hypothetical protein